MIWYYTYTALFWILRWFIPPPQEMTPKGRIKINAKCPACGHKKGIIRFTVLKTANIDQPLSVVEHLCKVCSCRWGELPIERPKIPITDIQPQ